MALVLVVILVILSSVLGVVVFLLVRRQKFQQPKAPELNSNSVPSETYTVPSSVVDIVDEQGTSDMQIRTASDADLWSTVPLPQSAMETARIQSALANFSPILSKMLQGGSGRFVLKFSPRITGMLGQGTATLMKGPLKGSYRAVARSARNGRILELGVLAKGGITISEVVLIGWEIAAGITLQKYLVVIQRSMARIENKVEEILKQMSEERQGKLIGNLRHIQQSVDDFGSYRAKQVDVTRVAIQLDSISRESQQVFESLRIESSRHLEELSNIQINDSKQREEQALNLAERFRLSSQQATIALFVKASADRSYKIVEPAWAGLPGRLEEIDKDMAVLKDLSVKYDKLRETRLPQIKSDLLDFTDAQMYQQRFDFAVRWHLAELKLMHDFIDQTTMNTRGALHQLQRGPEWMVVELERGQIVKCHVPLVEGVPSSFLLDQKK